MDAATVTSPTGYWSPLLKPWAGLGKPGCGYDSEIKEMFTGLLFPGN